jgi:hypothetical protein
MDSFFAELWAAAKQAGPFATMLLLLICYLLNEERKRERERNEALAERVLTGLRDSVEAIKDLAKIFRPPEKL